MLVKKERSALRIDALDRKAIAFGLTPGMTLADARARAPHLAVAQADPDADERLMLRLAAFCEQFTPLVALDPPCGLMLDATGCAHLFGGEAMMRTCILQAMARLSFTGRAAVAGTPDAARALARFGQEGVTPPGEDEIFTRPLSIAALEAPKETSVALTRAGLTTLGDLADRSSAALTARFGDETMRRLTRILGREDARITPLRPLPECMVERRFAEPFLDLSAIENVLRPLIAEAMGILERRGEGGRAFEARFFRTDGAVAALRFETGAPSRNVEALLRLFRLKAESLVDPLDPGFGFDVIRFCVLNAETLAQSQIGFERQSAQEGDVADLVDRLAARFGRERVLRFATHETHDPVRAASYVYAASPSKPNSWEKPELGEPPLRPLFLFDPPQPIDTMAETPDGPPMHFKWRRVRHMIARAEGPERIAPEWWRNVVGRDRRTRDYYRLEDREGHRFWVFREGLYESETAAPRWFLHGLFA
ncbi:DNA polymerase Y family protein [Methylocystis rosea]|uniref:DNA polymerase Y family protein n=1 Tax=Methylocystis rosea TaxID=173366 RepID=A0ABX6EM82_9HYPH|nr:DNA polymerase Y family protein [Methylocystis rosea]